MALFFFCAVALGQFAVGAAVLSGWIVWHGCTIRDRCSGVLAPVILTGLLYVLPSWMHCFAMAEQCNWPLNISDSILALMAIGCFLAMGRADANGRHGAIERSWTNLGCVLLLGLAALRVANVSIPILGNEIAGRALFVTVNDTAFAPIFGLLCISRVTSRRGTLIAHAAGHAAFAVLAASFAESRLLVIVSLISAATLVAMAMSGDRAFRRLALVAVLVAVTGAGIGLGVNDRLSAKLREGIDASLHTRAYLLETALRLWGESPILGRGSGAFELHYAEAHADFPPAREIDKRFVAWPHNAFVEVLLERGLVGVAGLLAAAGWFFWRTRLGATVSSQRRAIGGHGALVAALLFVALALVETSVHRVYFLSGAAAVVGTLFPCRLHNAKGAEGADEHHHDSSFCRRIARRVCGVFRRRKN